MPWDVLGVLAITAITATLLVALIRDEASGWHHRRRGTCVMPQADPHEDSAPPVLFHSKYCAGRYGSPCNCKGPHA